MTTSDKYEVLQKLPDVLPALPSLRRLGLGIDRFESILQEVRGELWGAVDRVFADSRKLSTVEYFEVMWNDFLEKEGEGKTSTNRDGESRSDRVGVYVDLLKDHFVDTLK